MAAFFLFRESGTGFLAVVNYQNIFLDNVVEVYQGIFVLLALGDFGSLRFRWLPAISRKFQDSHRIHTDC